MLVLNFNKGAWLFCCCRCRCLEFDTLVAAYHRLGFGFLELLHQQPLGQALDGRRSVCGDKLISPFAPLQDFSSFNFGRGTVKDKDRANSVIP